MADYKGYTIERNEGRSDAIVSPYGEQIALLIKMRGHTWPDPLVEGVVARDEYPHMGEMLRDIADQHRALIGETDEDPIITPSESRVIIVHSVKNLQINSNAFGIQITDAEVERIEAAVDKAPPHTLRKVLKEWIPQAFFGASISELLALLGLAVS